MGRTLLMKLPDGDPGLFWAKTKPAQPIIHKFTRRNLISLPFNEKSNCQPAKICPTGRESQTLAGSVFRLIIQYMSIFSDLRFSA